MDFNLNSNDNINKTYYESVQLISVILNKLSDSFIDLEEIINHEEALKQKIEQFKQDSNKK